MGVAGPDALQTLNALDLCLYSGALTAMTTLHGLQNQLLALVFKLSWGAQRSVQLADSYLDLTRSPAGSSRDSAGESDSEDLLEPELMPADSNTVVQQGIDQQVRA